MAGDLVVYSDIDIDNNIRLKYYIPEADLDLFREAGDPLEQVNWNLLKERALNNVNSIDLPFEKKWELATFTTYIIANEAENGESMPLQFFEFRFLSSDFPIDVEPSTFRLAGGSLEFNRYVAVCTNGYVLHTQREALEKDEK